MCQFQGFNKSEIISVELIDSNSTYVHKSALIVFDRTLLKVGGFRRNIFQVFHPAFRTSSLDSEPTYIHSPANLLILNFALSRVSLFLV